jgi:hypothetical protein
MKTKTFTDYEEEIIKKAYGRKAKPTLIADKSIEGLIRANMRERKTDWSIIRGAFKIFAI